MNKMGSLDSGDTSFFLAVLGKNWNQRKCICPFKMEIKASYLY